MVDIEKSTISISREHGTEYVFIRCVDRKEKKAVSIRLHISEFGNIVTGLVNDKNCYMNIRDI